MTPAPVRCPKCQAFLVGGALNTGEVQPCPACAAPLQVEVFPALFRRAEAGREGELVTADRESACFYHPQKKAEQACAACGRFVCALCDCELQGVHYCPACLETGKRKGKIGSLENERTLHGNLALTVALVPILITGPAAIYLAVRHWRAPSSLVQRQRWRLVLAAALGALQIVLWIVLLSVSL